MSNRSLSILLLFATLLGSNAFADEGFIKTEDGYRLYWVRAGSGPTTIIVPGALFLERDFLEPLAARATVVMYDMRNRGRSEFIPDERALTLQRDIDDLEAMRRHFGIERFATLGYSYLGKMVVLYALQHPGRVTRLVQIGPVSMKFGDEFAPAETTPVESPVPAEIEARLKGMRDDWTIVREPRRYCEEEWKASRLRVVGDPANAEPLDANLCHWYTEWPVNLARHFTANMKSAAALDVTAGQAETLDLPVLTIHGTHDRNAPYAGGRQWASALPNARLITVRGGAHRAWSDDPAVVDSVVTFFGGRWPESAQRVAAKP